MGKTFACTAFALAFALGALPASAEHQRFDRAHARDVALAAALRNATAQLYREAASRAGRVDRYEARALEALRQLDRQAGALRAQVARDGLHDRRTGSELRELRGDLARAERRLPALAHARGLRRDFARVQDLVGRFEAQLAAAGHGRHDRHARVSPRGWPAFLRR